MQESLLELKDKLLRALDEDYNVLDEDAVMEAISELNTQMMTKEMLETTRLGLIVNGLRRKTENDILAKRAKDLVKKWRGLFIGKKVAVESISSAPASPVKSTSSSSPGLPVIRKTPGSPNNNEAVARTRANNKRFRKDKEDDIIEVDEDMDYELDEAKSIQNGCHSASPVVPPPLVTDIVKEKISQLGKSPKVKTTQELLKSIDLKSRGGSPVLNASSEDNDSRRSNNQPTENAAEIRINKDEHMAKFLSSEPDGSTPTPSPPGSPTSKYCRRIMSQLPPIDESLVGLSDEEEENKLSVERVQEIIANNEQVEGITGNFEKTESGESVFREWHEPCIREGADGRKLVAFPYVIVD